MIKKEIKNRYVILVAASKGAVSKMIELISSNLSISIIPMGAGVVPVAGQVYSGCMANFKWIYVTKIWVLTEQDIFGSRQNRPQVEKRSDEFLREVSSLQTDDLVVHIEHGIGRYDGLETWKVEEGTRLFALNFAGGDRLYIPVEILTYSQNMDNRQVMLLLTGWGGCVASKKARIKANQGNG